jgi:peroxiredoxin
MSQGYAKAMMRVGDTAKDFTLPVGSKQTMSLTELLEGRRAVVLAFYLFDFSPV